MLCESVNNIYVNTNNQNDSSLDKTNLENKAIYTLNNSVERNVNKNLNNNLNKNLKENVKTNLLKINIMENICSDCESDENEKSIDKGIKNNIKIGRVSIGIQTENEIRYSKNKINNKTIEDLNNVNFDTQENLYSNDKKNTPKHANLYAPFSNKKTQITKKKEELKIIIENYFSINSDKVKESLIIKPKLNSNSLGKILSPNRTITNPQQNNCEASNTNINVNNDPETCNNLNSSISTNIYNNNFHNYSRYLSSGLSGNIHEKVVSRSVLTGANNFNNLNNDINNFNSNINLNYQIENLEIPEKSYEVRNEVNLFFRKIKHFNENEIQTDLLIVKF